MFRTYCSQWPVDGQRHVRRPILHPGPVQPGDVVGRYQDALAAGDVDAIVGTFAPDGYLREADRAGRSTEATPSCAPSSARVRRRWWDRARACAVTDDGMRCALEYNRVRWGDHECLRRPASRCSNVIRDGLLAAVRVYDDVESRPSGT